MTPQPGAARSGAYAEPVNGGILRKLARVGLVLFVLAAPVATGAVGYYLGAGVLQTARATIYPTWVDQEIRSTGTQNAGTLRCTYHLADGTSKISESVIRVVGGVQSPSCPKQP